MKKMMITLAAALIPAACGPAMKDAVKTAGPPPEILQKIQNADGSTRKGSYLALKEACRIYQGLYEQPAWKANVAGGYFRAAFLLSLREKELGLIDTPTAALAGRLIAENRALSGYREWWTRAGEIMPRAKGFMKDYIPGISASVLGEASKAQLEELRTKAGGDELAAYLYLGLACPGKSPYDKTDDVDGILAGHPASLILLYRSGFCPALKPEVFEAVLKLDPEFVEAYGFLGEAALAKGEVLTAERNLLRIYEHIPESPYFNILLASIYFFTEEFERCLEYCDRSIALAPEYRDAYLTKAISLSQLGRYADSIGVLSKIIEMQYYLQGEAHYWLSWNHHALNNLEAAQLHIEESKGRLPTNSEVFGLGGTIALGKSEWDRAEKEFRAALSFNASNQEALFGLARIAERRVKWEEAADFHQKAATVMHRQEGTIKDKIAQIGSSEMTEARKTAMIAKKEGQLKVIQATKAMAYFNGAVDWANAGNKPKAVLLARQAAEHPQYKTLVDELLAKIKTPALRPE